MRKILLLLCLAGIDVGIASCGKSGQTTMPPVGASSLANRASQDVAAASLPVGWALTGTHAVSLATGAVPLPDSVPLRIVVGLALRDPSGAQTYVHRQNTPGDSAFHVWLTPDQFTQMFGPTSAQASAVALYLQQHGFTNVTIEPNNVMISATGTASKAASAFHTSIQSVSVNGHTVYGNTTAALVPAQFKGVVIAVLGLTNKFKMNTHIVKSQRPMTMAAAPTGAMVTAAGTPPPSTPPPCLQVVNGICVSGEYGPREYQVAYDATKKQCPAACAGNVTSIAVMAEGNVSSVLTDLRTAETYWALPKVPYSVRKVGISSTDTAGVDEWDMDTQISSGIAQYVKHLYVYDTTSLADSDIALMYSHWVNDHDTQAGNSSFGEPESLAFADGSMLVDDEEFNQAAAQGMTMFASTGDNGTGCPVIAATGVPNTGVPEPCYPATSPYVVGVGGTTLDTNANGQQPGTYYGEHVWVGTGGGFSKYETAPYWQHGICALCSPAGLRGTADIAMCADNNGCPMDVFVGGAQTGVGGTSLSSPMSMGIWARLETHFGNLLGFAGPVYYGVYAYYEPCAPGSTACVPAGEPANDTAALPPDTTAPIGGFHDILFGSNGAPSSAAPGWDEPTGLGSVDYCVMQSAIANSVYSGH